MFSTGTFLFAALAAVVSAAPPCPPPGPPNSTVNYTLPSIGGGAPDLLPPADNLVVKKIAVGHGIQNYTCGSSTTGDSIAAGAVAVLYDVTSFYPGTKRTGIRKDLWDSLPSRALWEQPLPLNRLAGSRFGADPVAPFPANPAADLRLRGLPAAARFLGHHYFDIDGVPTFDLPAAAAGGLRAAVARVDSESAPATADKGVLATGAVPWLRLDDNGRGGSRGVASVFRVVTAGGNPQSCSVAGEGVQSIPYAAFYWFYG
ncbi:uncharacterized protein P884DRAFT_242586 [Thermothelomyces heterothallicus CBS 202.75]|uniref:uncharacterized protein n=1 Tax=Thermothelomyces heterothallicus CBS 202.75 TaxID=1149848 RepID=UPI0037449C26